MGLFFQCSLLFLSLTGEICQRPIYCIRYGERTHCVQGIICTSVDVLAARISKVLHNVGTADSSFPGVGKCCSGSLYKSTDPLEVVTHYVVEVPAQSCGEFLDTAEHLMAEDVSKIQLGLVPSWDVRNDSLM